MNFRKYLLSAIVRDGENGAGAGAGGAGAAGAGGAGAGAGAGAGGAGAGGAGGGAGGGGAQPFYSSYGLEKPAVDWIEGHKFSDPGTLIKTAMHFEKVGRDRNVMLKPDPAKLKEWDGWSELGWTPDATKYAVKPPDEAALKELGIPYSGELWGAMTKVAHDERVPLPALQAIQDSMLKWFSGVSKDAATAKASEEKAFETSLRKEWGPNYDAKREVAKRALQALGLGDEDASELEKVLGSDRFTKKLAAFGEKLGEDTRFDGQNQSGRTVSTVERELNAFEGDNANVKIMNDQRDPRHKDVMARRQALINELSDLQSKGNRRAA